MNAAAKEIGKTEFTEKYISLTIAETEKLGTDGAKKMENESQLLGGPRFRGRGA